MHLIALKCRILFLMARLLILIFAFNAFITPVSAMGVCEMMDESSAMMSSSMSDTMEDMNCGMNTDTVCCSVECANNCSATVTPQIFYERQTPIIVADHTQHTAGFAYFYTITHPVNTPPPLV